MLLLGTKIAYMRSNAATSASSAVAVVSPGASLATTATPLPALIDAADGEAVDDAGAGPAADGATVPGAAAPNASAGIATVAGAAAKSISAMIWSKVLLTTEEKNSVSTDGGASTAAYTVVQ